MIDGTIRMVVSIWVFTGVSGTPFWLLDQLWFASPGNGPFRSRSISV